MKNSNTKFRKVEVDLAPPDFRRLLEHAAKLAETHWRQVRQNPAFLRRPDKLARTLRAEAIPRTGRPIDDVLRRIEDEIVPYPLGMGHPRWWGFMGASIHPVGVAADVVAKTLNNACFAPAQIATDVELAVVRWLAELCRLPDGAGGVLTSGASIANLVCLAAAREAKAPGSRARGVAAGPRLAVYASGAAHGSVGQAVELLGWGSEALRHLPVDAAGRLEVTALRDRIAQDRAEGILPAVIVATCGTVGTGAIDPLQELVTIARDEACWFHVDGAYGAIGAALPELEERYQGIEEADSIVLDPHKWLYVPYEAAVALVRDPQTLRAAFAAGAAYLAFGENSYFDGDPWLSDFGPQFTREFRALKVWAVMQAVGLEDFQQLWRNDIAVCGEVVRLAHEHPRLEVLAPSELSIFCLRYLPRRGDADRFNLKLLDTILRDGRLFLNPITLDGKTGLRGCIVNFRSTPGDAATCIQVILELAEALESTSEVT